MWQIQPTVEIPDWIIPAIRHHAPQVDGRFAAQLLLSRGIQTPEQLAVFLDANLYKPANPFEFGLEMKWAVNRLVIARNCDEAIAIWGDFDADGITATSVLWDGLGQFFNQIGSIAETTEDASAYLCYYIPNRLTDSHGLNISGIETLAQRGVKVIVTCDTGSTNITEIQYAKQLGIDVIVTDHHTLPPTRPPVVSIINPRNLPPQHPMYHLSGVAVAYKLVEALYKTLPDIPERPLEDLLDLVAIGLIADLVQLTGDCRYLAQRGIEKLKQQQTTSTRPGVAKLLNLCKRTGDRPTDISFGLGPRINAVSRIQGDASFCVELLTSRDEKRCDQLALETELANTRRKSLQREVTKDVTKKLSQLDLSTTCVIVLTDPQWPIGVLGLVAGQVAQEYGRPTILLSTDIEGKEDNNQPLARGSARSVNQIDLYELVRGQAHLLHRFGGHPFAAGLSIPVENIPMFTEAINRQLREQIEQIPGGGLEPIIQIDLVCTVSELGVDLFQELKLLEPCGMGNPVPHILIENCWFNNPWHQNEKDFKGQKISYIKTTFELWDESVEIGFPGVWWGHYKDEVPPGRCDAVVELDYNMFKKRYEVRLLEVRPVENANLKPISLKIDVIIDWRNGNQNPSQENVFQDIKPLIIEDCPTSWDDLRVWFRRLIHPEHQLILAYEAKPEISPLEIWEKLIGIAKYLSRTGESVTRKKLHKMLTIGDPTLMWGFESLRQLGFKIEYCDREFYMSQAENQETTEAEKLAKFSDFIDKFFAAIQEERFRRQYFCEVPLSTIQAIAHQTLTHFSSELEF
ncbi:single-stranded-DNA-specific exonuclease RecJ [Limnoraphis robusta]|uniref:Single-stranded-DNA-specific exonuclease RecJ n=1 Tax=Limnoraphis robusta CCNP1315 TaxID=3110306 RepID=A0ABU5TXL0_9CYAN|nr:single-stranded-DNA-specific exonuclease RecJ [Limnoraphis robusta]MEA5519381.1 single-stranded-DNA-specific exonuclease RecJ [Limnoraphis robusta CCNP1315]MEA5545129.1 single-stranded-DNA-specific exonuclease RecJ [Limnoraphis robusta CCNP1324]